MANDITDDTRNKIGELYGRFGKWAAVGEHLAVRAGEPPQNAAAIGALMNKAYQGKIKSSRRVLELLGEAKRKYRIAICLRNEAEQTAVREWVKGMGYGTFNQWFQSEIMPEVKR